MMDQGNREVVSVTAAKGKSGFSRRRGIRGWPVIGELRRGFSRCLWLLLLGCLALPAQARTIVLDFWSDPSTDIYGYSTSDFDSSTFNFSGLDHQQVIGSLHDAVMYDFSGQDQGLLPGGMELNLDIELGMVGSAPAKGDPNFSFMQIGSNIGSPSTGSFGHACLGCGLNGKGSVIGSIFSDNIAGFAGLAANDQQLLNLIAGTITHEIGHTLSLVHPSGPAANPGESVYSVMGTGAPPTYMPNGSRVLDRAFSYDEYSQLISRVGLREASIIAVSAPASLWLMAGGILILGLRYRYHHHYRWRAEPAAN